MLAQNVKVNILGKINNMLYSAFADTNDKANARVYAVSRKHLEEYFEGVVVAVAEFDGLDKRAIVAPFGEIFYEPELRELLYGLKNVKLKELTCLYEKSCGALVFNRTKQNIKLLLIKNNNGRYWSFPKGHIEKGETEQQTALREIKEETGLDVTLIKGFKEISEYCPFGKIRKRVVFFLAQAFTGNVVIQEEEIDSYIWADIQQAKKLCAYENDLRIIDKAETALHILKY